MSGWARPIEQYSDMQNVQTMPMRSRGTRLVEVEAGHKPSKAQHGYQSHGDGKAKNVVVKLGKGCIAGVAVPLGEWNVWLRGVETKREAAKGAQVTGVGDGADGGVGILDDEGVHGDGEGLSDIGCLDAAVPNVCSRGLEGHV